MSPSGNAAPESYPARMTAHDLEHHDAFVALPRCLQAVKSINHRGNSTIKTEGHRRCLQVVIDCLRHSHHIEAFMIHLQRCGQRAITTNNNKRLNAQIVNVFASGIDDIAWNFGNVPLPNLSCKVSFVCCS